MRIKHTLIVAGVVAALLAGAWSALAVFRGSRPSAALAQGRSSVTPVAGAEDAADAAADTLQAQAILGELQAKYRLLDGVTVSIAATPADEQAIAYYQDGEIVVSPDRSATIQRILAHEIWHVIDWRDNGRLDWGEDLPPANASDYLN